MTVEGRSWGRQQRGFFLEVDSRKMSKCKWPGAQSRSEAEKGSSSPILEHRVGRKDWQSSQSMAQAERGAKLLLLS